MIVAIEVGVGVIVGLIVSVAVGVDVGIGVWVCIGTFVIVAVGRGSGVFVLKLQYRSALEIESSLPSLLESEMVFLLTLRYSPVAMDSGNGVGW